MAAFVGGIIAIYLSPGPYGQSYIQHLSAGVIFVAVAAKLLPDIHNEAPELVVIGFAVGVATMLGLHQGSRLLEQSSIDSVFGGATSLISTVSTNMLIDGLLIGVAFLSSPKTVAIIAVALAFETLFIGATAVSIHLNEFSTWKNWQSHSCSGLSFSPAPSLERSCSAV